MNVLVVGGAGFIGGVTTRLFASHGHDVVVLDNLKSPTSRADRHPGIQLIEADIRDREIVRQTIADHSFDVVLHFAALIYVGESVKQPFEYFQNNVLGSLNLIDAVATS
jgi:UDP-glucose 4-epimerase